MSRHNENQIETERISTDTPKPHLIPQMEVDDEETQTATFKSIKRLVINWMFRALGIAAVFAAGVLYRHEITLNKISQTVDDMSKNLQEMQVDQRENNKLLIQLLQERGR